jgi:hypothetical protein
VAGSRYDELKSKTIIAAKFSARLTDGFRTEKRQA